MTKKKNIRHSDSIRDGESRDEYLERLGLGSFSSTRHKRTVNGSVASSLIEHNNLDIDFMNQYRKIENSEGWSEKNINKDFNYNAMFSLQGTTCVPYYFHVIQ